jgi:hypothetical protein
MVRVCPAQLLSGVSNRIAQPHTDTKQKSSSPQVRTCPFFSAVHRIRPLWLLLSLSSLSHPALPLDNLLS